jgi:D-aminopeptidase
MMYSTKALRAGMTLQDAVRDAKGQILLPAGVVLGDNSIAQLLQRGVPAVSVVAVESEEERSARIGREAARVLELFGEFGATAELEQMRRLVLERTDAS